MNRVAIDSRICRICFWIDDERALSWHASSTPYQAYCLLSFFISILLKESIGAGSLNVGNCSVINTEFVTLYIKSKYFTFKKSYSVLCFKRVNFIRKVSCRYGRQQKTINIQRSCQDCARKKTKFVL